jgi:hypothetical protein
MRILTEAERRMVVDSGLFDPAWYSERYPDVALTSFAPLEHFLRVGGFFLRNPGPLFDAAHYTSQLSGMESAVEFPLLHYIGFGWCRGLKPHPDFSADWYLPPNVIKSEYDNFPEALLAQVPKKAHILLLEDCGSDDMATLSGRHVTTSDTASWKHLAGIGLKNGELAVRAIRRIAGASWEYLVVGAETYRRIQRYQPFGARFAMSFPAVLVDDGLGMVFDLRLGDRQPELRDFLEEFKKRERRYPSVLNWQGYQSMGCFFPDSVVFSSPNSDAEALPYIDSSIDIVLVPKDDTSKTSEAKRVAKAAVIEITIIPGKSPCPTMSIYHCSHEIHVRSKSAQTPKKWLGQITPADQRRSSSGVFEKLSAVHVDHAGRFTSRLIRMD